MDVLVTSLDRVYSHDECKRFDLIASPTTGTDHIQNGDVPLISLKGAGFLRDVHATAEHTIGLMLALVRRIPFAHNDVCIGNWNREAWQGAELYDKTLGIVGYGRVGQQVAKIAGAFGMNVVSCDKEEGLLNTVLRHSDVITVHIPLTTETCGMFGREQFNFMKPTAYFINTSRGAVVDESALLVALNEHKIAGAALDVLCNEPNINCRLVEYANAHDNLLITPHLGGNTAESRKKCQIYIADKIREFINRSG